MTKDEQDATLLTPFARRWEAARKITEIGFLLERAALQVKEPADSRELIAMAYRAYAEAKRIRDSIPTPTDRPVRDRAVCR